MHLDNAFVSVGSCDMQWSAKIMEPYLAPEGVLISAQHSVNQEQFAPLLGSMRILGWVARLGAPNT